MNKILPAAIAMALFAGGCTREEAVALQEPEQKISYSIGYQVGSDFRRQGVDLRPEVVLRGVEDALSGAGPLMKTAEMQTTLVALKRRVSAQEQQAQGNLAAENLARSASFMTQNALQPGVEKLPSGLQYKVMRPGDGAAPRPGDTVTVHYRGTLIDGSEFDSSYSRNQPATFSVNKVIAGWTEALQLMPEGSKWQLFIPPELAYGERGAGNKIPPNSALVFEVELLSVH